MAAAGMNKLAMARTAEQQQDSHTAPPGTSHSIHTEPAEPTEPNRTAGCRRRRTTMVRTERGGRGDHGGPGGGAAKGGGLGGGRGGSAHRVPGLCAWTYSEPSTSEERRTPRSAPSLDHPGSGHRAGEAGTRGWVFAGCAVRCELLAICAAD